MLQIIIKIMFQLAESLPSQDSRSDRVSTNISDSFFFQTSRRLRGRHFTSKILGAKIIPLLVGYSTTFKAVSYCEKNQNYLSEP